MEIRVRVTLNGTDRNPYEKLGLTANPFRRWANPDIAGWAAAMLADLESRPIADNADLAQRLTPCSNEFKSLCMTRFVHGRVTTFFVIWEA